MKRWRRRKGCRLASWMKIRHHLTRRGPRPGNKTQNFIGWEKAPAPQKPPESKKRTSEGGRYTGFVFR